MMLEDVMRETRNYFAVREFSGQFTIEDGVLSPQYITEGQYFLVEGSVFNDGVYQYGDNLTDEKFTGHVLLLAPPASFLSLVKEIEDYQDKYGEASPYTSESFGGYSYTKATGNNGGGVSWADAFSKRLNAWRKA